jgi:hypothetical protein
MIKRSHVNLTIAAHEQLTVRQVRDLKLTLPAAGR